MLLPFFQWCGETTIGITIRDSVWLFPVIQCFHLLALAMMGGVLLVVDLRLLGLGLRRQTVARLAKDVQPWLIGSLLVMLTSGVMLFTSETLRCYYNASFWLKMQLLPVAILFTFTVRRKVTAAEEGVVRPVWNRLVAIISLSLWLGVGLAGRWIAFY